MTVVASVKTCLASLKGAQASLSTLSQNAAEEETKRVFHECMMEMDSVIADLQKRISVLEREEPQYKGF
jgi:exonuclease VII small subunit